MGSISIAQVLIEEEGLQEQGLTKWFLRLDLQAKPHASLLNYRVKEAECLLYLLCSNYSKKLPLR